MAMYFAFLGFYMMALIPPAFMGFLTLLLTWQHVTMQVSFCVMNLIWATVFLEMWKRYAATLAYKWGSLGEMKFEAARAEYYGSLGTNAITGRLEPKYPKRKRVAKFYGGSVPVVASCLLVAVMIMLVYFRVQAMAEKYHQEENGYLSGLLLRLPSAIYATVISVMNIGYRKLAKKLNDWGERCFLFMD